MMTAHLKKTLLKNQMKTTQIKIVIILKKIKIRKQLF